jgi:predicted metalloprotease with PDZ domain
LGPFNYNSENYTDQLWVAEGITSYYDELALLRAGLIGQLEYLDNLSENINSLENRPGSKVQTLAESSRDAWIKEYRPHENSSNTTISYYSKGLVVAALLDITICKESKGKHHLDDLMKLLYQRYFKEKNRGFTAEEFQQCASEIAGVDLNGFFKLNVYSTEMPKYEIAFEGSGIGVDIEDRSANKLGTLCIMDNGKTLVKEIQRGSTAAETDIQAGDELISINGIRIHNDENKILDILNYPDSLDIILNRKGIIREVTVKYKPIIQKFFIFSPPSDNTKANTIFNKWLGN